jgi:hypothetical protein
MFASSRLMKGYERCGGRDDAFGVSVNGNPVPGLRIGVWAGDGEFAYF